MEILPSSFMNNDKNIPDDDRDKLLAKQIEALNSGAESAKSGPQEPLLDQLHAYREKVNEATAPGKKESEASWSQIQHQLSDDESKATVHSLEPQSQWVQWAIAASFLIIASLVLFKLFQPATPELIAATESKIEVITLDDGSRITLRPYSRFTRLPQPDRQQGQTYRLEGEGYFEVAHNPERTFAVRTDLGQVEVLGTTFTVSSWGNRTEVFLKEGKVLLKSLVGNQKLILNPGEQSSVVNGKVLAAATASEERFTDWMDRELVIENEPLQQLLPELEHHFNVQISADSSLASERLSGRILLTNQEEALRDLATIMNAELSKTADNRYRISNQ